MNDNYDSMTIEELEARLIELSEDGHEILLEASAYDVEELNASLAEIGAEMDHIESIINNKKENAMKCVCITREGKKCRGKKIDIVDLMVRGGDAVHADLVKASNLPGFFLRSLPVCSAHQKSLSTGKKLNVFIPRGEQQKLDLAPEIVTETPQGEPRISCGNCKAKHHTPAEVAACHGVERKVSHKPIVKHHPNSTSQLCANKKEAILLLKKLGPISKGMRPTKDKDSQAYWVWWAKS